MIIKKEQKFYNNERKNNNLKKQPGLFDKIPGPGILKKNAIKISIATTVFSSFVINKTNAQFTFRNTALAVAGGVSCYLKP